jgi:putative peptidoglycan lipid II flippase
MSDPEPALQPPSAPESVPAGDARRGIIRSALAVGLITFLSRITGLIRESTMAHFLATGVGADAFRIALQIPGVFRRLVGEGAISSAFVPVFTRHVQKQDPHEIRIFAEKFYTLWTAGLLAITLAGVALAGGILLSLQGIVSWTPDRLALTASLTRWLFPYLFLVGLSAVAQGILNSYKVFALPSATPLLFNLAFIASGWLVAPLLEKEDVPYAFAGGVLAGGFLQIAILVPPIWKLGIRLRPRWPGGHPGVREVLRLLLPGAFGAGIYQINVCISSFLAMRIPAEGPVAALGYAGRLMEVVLGIFVFALSTVSLTTLSRQAASGDRPAFRATLSEVIRLTVFITVPSGIGLYLLRESVVSLIFRSGDFTPDSAALTIAAFEGYIPGIVIVGVNRILVSAFYAFQDTRTPVKVGAVNLAVNVAFCLALMPSLAHVGIAAASTLAALVQGIWLVWTFTKRERDLLAAREILRSAARSILASVVLGGICLAFLQIAPAEERGKLVLGAWVLGTILAAAAAYFIAARILGAPEAGMLFQALRRRRR